MNYKTKTNKINIRVRNAKMFVSIITIIVNKLINQNNAMFKATKCPNVVNLLSLFVPKGNLVTMFRY